MKKNKKNRNFNISNDLTFDESVNNINKILNGDTKIAIAEDYDFDDKSLEEELSNQIDLVLSLNKDNKPEYVSKPINVLKEDDKERENNDNINNGDKHDTKEPLMTLSDCIKSLNFLGVINYEYLDDEEYNAGDVAIIEIHDVVDDDDVFIYNVSAYDGTEWIKIGDLDLEDFLDEDDLEDDDDDDDEDWVDEVILSDNDIDSEFDKMLIEDIDDDDDDELLDIEDADDESLDIEESDDVIEEDVRKESSLLNQTSVEETPQASIKEETKSIATDVDTSSEKKDVADVISFKEKKDEKEFQEFREELAEKVLDTIDEVASGNITDDEYEDLLSEKEDEDYSQYMKSNRKQSPQKMKNSSKKDKSDDWVVPKRK